MFLEIVTGAERFLPFHEQGRSTAGAQIVGDRNIAGVPDLAAPQVDAQAEIRVVDVQEELVIHSTQLLKTPARDHHECTADDRYARRLAQRLLLEQMQALEIRMIGKKAIEP